MIYPTVRMSKKLDAIHLRWRLEIRRLALWLGNEGLKPGGAAVVELLDGLAGGVSTVATCGATGRNVQAIVGS